MARTAWQKSFGVLVIAVLGSLSVQGHPLDDLARQALAVDPGAEGAREELRAAGLSSQKVRYARALAEARIDFKGLRDAPLHRYHVPTLR